MQRLPTPVKLWPPSHQKPERCVVLCAGGCTGCRSKLVVGEKRHSIASLWYVGTPLVL